MSASSKKKLRKEQAAAQLTEKQQKERVEAKKLKNTTIIFVVIMLAVALTAATVLAIRAFNNSGIKEKSTIAAVTGDHEINGVEFNYFYTDYVNSYYTNFQNMYGDYASLYMMMMGLDPTQALDAQVFDEESGATWADTFQQDAMAKAKDTYALYDKAMSENFTLPEDEQLVLEYTMEQLEVHTLLYGFRNVNDFLRSAYGPGSNVKSYEEYCTVSTIANAYYNAKGDSLVYSEDDLRAYDDEHPLEYTSFDYAVYYVSYTDYAEGGTEDENGNVLYSDEEKAAALEKAEQVAELLATAKNVDDLDKAIQNLDINADNASAASSKNTDVFYPSIPTQFQEWLAEEGRVENDITMIPYTITTTDDEGNESSALNGYYVVAFQDRDENLRPLANIRHLLVSFEGGTTAENGNVSFSDAEKAAAKATAEELLQLWKDGDATEESFIALVKEHTDDTASAENGGLYEDIHYQSNYVAGFLDWAIADDRKQGDVEIVESAYGYHIMYYVSDDELTTRDYLITNTLRSQDLQEWYNGICDAETIEMKDTSCAKKGIIIASS